MRFVAGHLKVMNVEELLGREKVGFILLHNA
jgi:hypothetical protein